MLLIIDTNIGSVENIVNICKFHDIVIMIDHHTSFIPMKS